MYSLSVSIIVSILNHLDPSGAAISARSYALQVGTFMHCASMAFSQANAITAGWYMGAGNEEDCTLSTAIAARCSILAALSLGTVLAVFSPLFMRFFSQDQALIGMVQKLLFINLALEFGRAVNLCYGGSLKAIGDARFPMAVGVVFMLAVAAGGTWLMGCVLRISPAPACFIAMAMDECVRALCMKLRWRSGVWRSKVLIRQG